MSTFCDNVERANYTNGMLKNKITFDRHERTLLPEVTLSQLRWDSQIGKLILN